MCNKANLRDLIAATGLVILLKLDSNHRFFSPCDLEIWWITPKDNRTPVLYYFKLFASLRSHWWVQTGVTVWKHLIWVKIDDFVQPCDLAVWRMTLKNKEDLCYATSSLVHHSVAIGEFKLELQFRNAYFGSKLTIFFSCVTLKFDGWHWKTTGHLYYAISSFMHHFIIICELNLELRSWNG